MKNKCKAKTWTRRKERKPTCRLRLRRLRSRAGRVEVFGADGDADARRGGLILLLLLRLLLLGALLGVLAAHAALADSTLKSRKLQKLHLNILSCFDFHQHRPRFRFHSCHNFFFP